MSCLPTSLLKRWMRKQPRTRLTKCLNPCEHQWARLLLWPRTRCAGCANSIVDLATHLWTCNLSHASRWVATMKNGMSFINLSCRHLRNGILRIIAELLSWRAHTFGGAGIV
jgi:hypothetical protein